MKRHQMGDTEMRAVFPSEALEAGCGGDPSEAEADPDLPTEPPEPSIRSHLPIAGAAFD